MPTLVLPPQSVPAIVDQAHVWMQSASGSNGIEAFHLSELAREALRHWSERAEVLVALFDSEEDTTYDHLRLETKFIAKVHYKLVGKLQPRRFPIDD